MGPPAEPAQPSSVEQAENARLKAEAAALRQALKEKKAELEALKAASE
ncbi:MAG: S-adenosyl-L-homocysteine hydrolase [Zetaproteobacteria bacterium CG12_big_fil_rev_8_21_14_0_65_54_13]|nr:MAG: S-adenosyl-L-homocysteine hydrolase [Zetaproteobacteria bacterium CG12_big_fil_rev_8_21_14_0_65_54_13]PIX55392.1 MAG: S-adenosyl-L-homocysteine hydrolase [Zetaproteobacteria bacterium CG_4_10_14_3_um_filter_54_28]PJA27129.1 MAG: S-adenosyl-L-homocysteine hydrolase [Zetaproteobacteria bacterium CG_4_9_14_3_um_filter_54_145]